MPGPLIPDSASPQELAGGTQPRPECSQAWQLPGKVLHFLDDLPGGDHRRPPHPPAGGRRPDAGMGPFLCVSVWSGIGVGPHVSVLFCETKGSGALHAAPAALGAGCEQQWNRSGLPTVLASARLLGAGEAWPAPRPSADELMVWSGVGVPRCLEITGRLSLSWEQGHGWGTVVSHPFIPRGVGLVLGAQCLRCWPPERVLGPPGQPWGPVSSCHFFF